MLPAERSGRANLLLWIYFHQDGWLPSFPPLQWLIAAGGVRILALLKRLRPEKDFGRSPCFSPDTGPDIFFSFAMALKVAVVPCFEFHAIPRTV